MKLNNALRKTGIFRAGATSGTYTNAKDRPVELQMEGVFNAEKDLVTSHPSVDSESLPKNDTANTESAKQNNAKSPKSKWKIIVVSVFGGLVALIVLMAVFGSPSAEMVFKDSLDTMLQTESLTVKQEFVGSGSEVGSLKMDATHFIILASKDLNAKGTFSIQLQSDGVPIAIAGEYIALDDSRYVKIEKLGSSNSEYDAQFSKVLDRLKDKWLIARETDSFSTIATTPVDALTEITALPFGYVDDTARKNIVSILQDEKSFTIQESSKVTIEGAEAYRYELQYDKSKQKEVAKKLSEAIGYLKVGDGDKNNSEVKSLELWINTKTKQFIKMKYTGTSDDGNINAVITFSDYGKKDSAEKPNKYYIESELLN